MPFHDVIGHDRPKAILRAALRHDRVAHAYLFYGEANIGKRLMALRFAQAVNCESDPGPEGPDACGACRSCQQTERQTHPDVALIEPDREAATPQIRIEQIRELDSQLVYRPLVGRWKVCLVDEADRMTLAAANALLKTLEEPPAHCLFLLISDRPLALPATVRSRCQAIRFAPPAPPQIEAALIARRALPPETARVVAMAAQGRIGLALHADPDRLRAQGQRASELTDMATLRSVAAVLGAAETLAKGEDGTETLDWLAGWLRDTLLVRIGADPDSLVYRDWLTHLRTLAAAVPPESLLDLLDDLDALQRSAARHLNLQMALESLLLRLRDAVTPASR